MEQMTQIEQKPGCVAAALHILGDKWTPLLLKELVESSSTFGELETSLVSISPRTLSQRLDKLISEQIVEKSIYCEHPPRYTYKLTKKGSELEKILRAMADWGAKHYDPTSTNC